MVLGSFPVPLLLGDKASPALPLWLMDAGVTFNFEDRNAEDLLFGEVEDFVVWKQSFYVGMDQYTYSIFRGGWTSINPSYFDVNKRGTRFWLIPT